LYVQLATTFKAEHTRLEIETTGIQPLIRHGTVKEFLLWIPDIKLALGLLSKEDEEFVRFMMSLYEMN